MCSVRKGAREVHLLASLEMYVGHPPMASAVNGLVGYKFELCNQPIAHLELRTGSGTGLTGSTR